jgi:hypothetical protein
MSLDILNRRHKSAWRPTAGKVQKQFRNYNKCLYFILKEAKLDGALMLALHEEELTARLKEACDTLRADSRFFGKSGVFSITSMAEWKNGANALPMSIC